MEVCISAEGSLVRQPLERLDEAHKSLDEWEIVLYIMALSFLIEGNNSLLSRNIHN